jgi:RNA polymerase sigma-70 factor, ECF subfamily
MSFQDELIALIPQLRRFARGLCGDAALADDLVQDTIERALAKSHLYDPARPLKAWAYTILRNLFVSGVRHERRSSVVKTLDDLAPGEGTSPPEQDHRLSAAQIREALDLLPAQQREVIVMVALEELSYREISEMMGVPVGTVMSRLCRGRQALRVILEKRGQPFLRRVK